MAELSAQAAVPRTRDGRRSRRVFRNRHAKDAVQQATDAGLDLLRVLGWQVLHDMVVPGDPEQDRQAAIVDHLLAGPSGVYVVNTVTWSGPIHATDHSLTVGKVDRAEELAEVSAAAELVRAVLPGIPVAPMLCFERLEQVTGVAGDVALCASENILDLLTSQRTIVDQAGFIKASRTLAAVCRPDARKYGARPTAKSSERDKRDNVVTAMPQQAAESTPAEPASVAATAEDIVRVAAFERLMDGADQATDVPDSSDSFAVIHEAGAALWRDLTSVPDLPDLPDTELPNPELPDTDVPDTDLAETEVPASELEADEHLEAEALEAPPELDVVPHLDLDVVPDLDLDLDVGVDPEAEEERERASADAAATRARERKAREALERVRVEALRLAEQEAAELVVRAAEAERADAERLEAERVDAERIRAEQAEAERIRAEQVEAERAEAERIRAEQVEAERVWAEQMASEQAEQTAAERVEQPEPDPVEETTSTWVEQTTTEWAEQSAPEDIEADRIQIGPEQVDEPESVDEPDAVDLDQPGEPLTDHDVEAQASDDDEIQARADRVAAIREREAQRARERAEQEAADSRPARRRMADPDPRPSHTPGMAPATATGTATAIAPSGLALAETLPTPARPVREPRAAKAHAHLAEDGEERPTRALLLVALGALLIAGVVIGGPRVSDLVSQVHGLFTGSPATQVGTAVAVNATGSHPDVTLLAGSPVAAHATGGFRVPKGQHLVAVPLRFANDGLVRWDITAAPRVSVTDADGATRTVAKTVTGLRGVPILPTQAQVAPGDALTGYVAFTVPDGQDVRSVRVSLSNAGGDTVTWQVSP